MRNPGSKRRGQLRMRPSDRDMKFVMDYFKFTPGEDWGWRYSCDIWERLTYTNKGYPKALECELAYALLVGTIYPMHRFYDKIDSLEWARNYCNDADISF